MQLTGVSWPWTNVPVWIYDDDVLNQALDSVLFTPNGDMKMDGSYGSQLEAIVFENTGRVLEALAKREIVLSVSKNLPFMTIQNIDIVEDEDNNEEVTIFVYYKYNEITGVVSKEFVKSTP